jgi:hypothetical protein
VQADTRAGGRDCWRGGGGGLRERTRNNWVMAQGCEWDAGKGGAGGSAPNIVSIMFWLGVPSLSVCGT